MYLAVPKRPRRDDYYPLSSRGYLNVKASQTVLDLFVKTANARGIAPTTALIEAGCSKSLLTRYKGKEISAVVYGRLKNWILRNTPTTTTTKEQA